MTTSDSPSPKPMTAETEAEKKLLRAVKTGGVAKVSGRLSGFLPPCWPHSDVIRADFLRHVCLHPDLYEVHPGGIHISGALVQGSLNLSFCEVKRPLALDGCCFDQCPNFMFSRTRFMVFKKCALPGFRADGLSVSGVLKMNGSVVTGEVRLLGADIGGQLGCEGATFANQGEDAFSADHLKVGGGVILKDVTATGEMRLLSADIKGQLVCEGATFTNTQKGGKAFNAQGLKVADTLFWQPEPRSVGEVDFRFAHVGVLADDEQSWPQGLTLLDGFEYKRFVWNLMAEMRIAWLRRMPDRDEDGVPIFWPQPYEQVIKVFKDSGHEHEARKVAIAKQDAYAAHLKRVQEDGARNTLLRRAWMGFLKITAGYGYEPWRALLWASWFILVMGWSVFGGTAYSGHMKPAKERIYISACFTDLKAENCGSWKTRSLIGESRYTMALPPDYPAFSAFWYSLDVFVPIVDLHQESYWLPNEGQYRIYMWLHIVAGWVLTTIAVTGFAGVLKKD